MRYNIYCLLLFKMHERIMILEIVNERENCFSQLFFSETSFKNTEALEGGPIIPYPFKYFEKYPISLKINMANFPKIQKALYPHIPKIDPNILYPLRYLQKISCIPLIFRPISLFH